MRLALLVFLLPCLIEADKLPLCSDNCSCIFVNDTLVSRVTCTKDVKDLVMLNSTWINPATTKPYPYLAITLTNQNFIELNFTFPDSDVTYLNLANNDIYRIRGGVFQDLQSMEVLILSSNDLELLSPDAFRGKYMPERYEPLKSLVELRLDHNRLHSLNMDIFEHTTDLEILDLSYNPFKVLDPHTIMAIDSLPQLKELYLGYTQISTLPELMLHTPLYLSILDLSGNPIDKVPETLAESHNLTELYLNDTSFVNMTKENGFPDIPSLQVLHLCHMQHLERIEKGALSGLINLYELRISDNIKLTHLDGDVLKNNDDVNGGGSWPMIRKLHLGNNKLSYLDSEVIARWDQLIELDIRANPWTCECENQWIVDELIPRYQKIDQVKASQVRCGAPIEMVSYTLQELKDRNYQMRCLDEYGAHPEKDALLLVGILAGVLIAIPLILLGIYAYQKRWFGLFSMCDNSPAAYSRRYYNATAKEEDF
ncbi:hypothetical protein HUJ04_000584 [Dendroctonus ponderosae]